MTIYSMNRWAANEAQVCKDNICYETNASSIPSTWRAVQWDGTSGWIELCDGTNYDMNIGEQTILNESELSVLNNAWQIGYDINQQLLAEQAAAFMESLETNNP